MHYFAAKPTPLIRFFKLNDPYRLLAILLFLLVTRIGAILLENPFTYVQQESETIGQFVNDGGLVIESLGPTNAGPLYALFYGLITYISQDTAIISAILSALFVFLQAFLLNTILIRLAAFNDNSYVPAIIYAVLMSTSPELMTLGPEMVSITFVLIGLNYLLTHLKYRGSEENIISTGFTFGLAALFAKAAFFFLPFTILIYLLYSSTLNRRYFLFAFGFGMPFVLMWLYYFWNGAGADFWSGYMSQLVHIEGKGLVLHQNLLAWAALPVLMALVAAAQNFTGVGMTNNQIQIQRTMLWMGIFGMIYYLISANGSFSEFIWIMPATTYFITLLLNSIQKPALAEGLLQILLWAGLYIAFVPMIDEALAPFLMTGLK